MYTKNVRNGIKPPVMQFFLNLFIYYNLNIVFIVCFFFYLYKKWSYVLQIECSSIVDYAQKIVDSNKFSDGKFK